MQKHLRNVGLVPVRSLIRLIKLLTLSLLAAGAAVAIIAVRHLLTGIARYAERRADRHPAHASTSAGAA